MLGLVFGRLADEVSLVCPCGVQAWDWAVPFPRRDCAEILRFRVYKSMKDQPLHGNSPVLSLPSLPLDIWAYCGFTFFVLHYPRDPSIQIIPTLGPKVYK